MAERARAEGTEGAEQGRSEQAERLHAAREPHDGVSHTLSVITVRSGVAARLARTRPEEVPAALTAIEEAARTAMADLRRMLGPLQEDGSGSAPAPVAELAPVPGLVELELLASAPRASHGAVELAVDPGVERAAESLRLAVYRLVQEALTNVRKHAPGASVRVFVRAVDDGIEVEVGDDRARGRTAPNGAGANAGAIGDHEHDHGYGHAGMRERVALFDGDLVAGPTAGGGFRVLATLRDRSPVTVPRETADRDGVVL